MLSMDLYTSWATICAEVGRDIPITHIEYNRLIHRVADGDPPLQSQDGNVRVVSLEYHFEEYEDDLRD